MQEISNQTSYLSKFIFLMSTYFIGINKSLFIYSVYNMHNGINTQNLQTLLLATSELLLGFWYTMTIVGITMLHEVIKNYDNLNINMSSLLMNYPQYNKLLKIIENIYSNDYVNQMQYLFILLDGKINEYVNMLLTKLKEIVEQWEYYKKLTNLIDSNLINNNNKIANVSFPNFADIDVNKVNATIQQLKEINELLLTNNIFKDRTYQETQETQENNLNKILEDTLTELESNITENENLVLDEQEHCKEKTE